MISKDLCFHFRPMFKIPREGEFKVRLCNSSWMCHSSWMLTCLINDKKQTSVLVINVDSMTPSNVCLGLKVNPHQIFVPLKQESLYHWMKHDTSVQVHFPSFKKESVVFPLELTILCNREEYCIPIAVSNAETRVDEQIQASNLVDALQILTRNTHKINERLQDEEPWKKDDTRNILGESLQKVCEITRLLAPFLP